jgi:hypothetical protein
MSSINFAVLSIDLFLIPELDFNSIFSRICLGSLICPEWAILEHMLWGWLHCIGNRPNSSACCGHLAGRTSPEIVLSTMSLIYSHFLFCYIRFISQLTRRETADWKPMSVCMSHPLDRANCLHQYSNGYSFQKVHWLINISCQGCMCLMNTKLDLANLTWITSTY